MNRRRLVCGTAAVLAASLGAVSCTSILGDFSVGGANGGDASSDSGGTTDSSTTDSGVTDSSASTDGATCDGGLICSGTCAIIASDPQNCNRCGHDCGAGALCKSGVCQPVLINSSAASLVSLATDQPADNPSSATLHIFWTVTAAPAGVFQDNISGGNIVTLDSSAADPSFVVVHAAAVYWPTYNFGNGAFSILQGTVSTAAAQNSIGAGTGAVAAIGSVDGILYDGTGNNIYGGYENGANNGYGVFKCPLTGAAGCVNVVSFSGLAAKNIATDGTSVFVADQNGGVITAVAIASGNTSPAITGAATPNLLRVDGTHLYWSNSGSKTLWRSALSGAMSGQIASTPNAADGIAADAVNIYWTDSTAGTVSYAPVGGGGSTTVYVTQTTSATAMQLVRDSKFLFWNNGTSLYRVALP